MYPAELTQPMVEELVSLGFQELKTAQEVDACLSEKDETIFLVINSVCGCAAGAARPGIKKALELTTKTPNKLVTVFAGVDTEAVSQARNYTMPYPPSSPSMALFKNGKLVQFVERHQIEGNIAETIGTHLTKIFEAYC